MFCRGTLGAVVKTTILDREVYTEPVAARLLGIPASTLHYWLQGGERGGVTYAPVIRPEPVDRRTLTWAEFIDAGWLRTYRRQRGIPMKQLGTFIQVLRDELAVLYPLAHQRPLVSGKQLVLRAQRASDLDPEYRLVATSSS